MGLSNAERQERWRVKRNKEIEQLRKAANGGAEPASQELAALRKRVRELEAALAARPASKPAKADEMAAAEKKLRKQDAQLRGQNFAIQMLLQQKALFGPAEFKTILRCLHPDNSASPEVRARAFDLVRQKEQAEQKPSPRRKAR